LCTDIDSQSRDAPEMTSVFPACTARRTQQLRWWDAVESRKPSLEVAPTTLGQRTRQIEDTRRCYLLAVSNSGLHQADRAFFSAGNVHAYPKCYYIPVSFIHFVIVNFDLYRTWRSNLTLIERMLM